MPFQWRWYYHVPALALWALIVLLLVVPKANRHRQAWLILIPLAVVLIVWRMLAHLLSMSDDPSGTEGLGFYVVSATMAWSMVWLLGHWLASRFRYVTFFLSLGMMLAIGLLSCYCHFADTDNRASLLICYSICVVILLLATTLAGYFCRKKYSPRRFLGWLIVWNVLVAMGVLLPFVGIVTLVTTIMHPGPQLDVGGTVVTAVITVVVSIFLGGVLYLLNLPFLILAQKSPFYRERFESMFLAGKTDAAPPGGLIPGDSADRPAELSDPSLPDRG